MSAVSQPWKVWLAKEQEDAVSSSSDSEFECATEKPWLKWKPTPEDPSVKPWLSWNPYMDNGDVSGSEHKRIRTHVMGACSSFAGIKK